MQIGILKSCMLPTFTFNFNPKTQALRSQDLHVDVYLTDEVVAFQFERDSEEKVLLFPEFAYGEAEETLLKLDADGWSGVELDADEWTFAFVMDVIQNLTTPTPEANVKGDLNVKEG